MKMVGGGEEGRRKIKKRFEDSGRVFCAMKWFLGRLIWYMKYLRLSFQD